MTKKHILSAHKRDQNMNIQIIIFNNVPVLCDSAITRSVFASLRLEVNNLEIKKKESGNTFAYHFLKGYTKSYFHSAVFTPVPKLEKIFFSF